MLTYIINTTAVRHGAPINPCNAILSMNCHYNQIHGIFLTRPVSVYVKFDHTQSEPYIQYKTSKYTHCGEASPVSLLRSFCLCQCRMPKS